jgi:peptidyl-prolyl cis-trans isomerase C
MAISGVPALALALALTLVLGGCGAKGSGDSLARVGETEITVADFELAALDHPLITGDRSPEARRVLLEDLIDRELIIQEARNLGYTESQEFADASKRIRETTLNEQLYRILVSDLVQVSEFEVQAAYQKRSTETRLSQIFAFSRAEAAGSVRRLESGEPFEEVARSTSVEPGTMTRGGDIGYVTGGEIPSAIERVLRDLEVGEWGGPVFSGTGYYLIQVTERRERERQPYEEVKDQLAQVLRLRKERALVLGFVQRLKARSKIQHVDASFLVLAERWQNRTAEELLESRGDVYALGFTDEELAMPLVSYRGGAYTIQDLFHALLQSPTMERPPASSDPLLRLWVEDRVVERLLIESAERKGIAERPEVARRIRGEEGSFLINQIYERVIVPSATVSDEELESLRGEILGVGGGESEQQRTLNERAVQLYEQKRQNYLKDLIVRLRLQTPPVINEDRLSRVPWPVTSREKA